MEQRKLSDDQRSLLTAFSRMDAGRVFQCPFCKILGLENQCERFESVFQELAELGIVQKLEVCSNEEELDDVVQLTLEIVRLVSSRTSDAANAVGVLMAAKAMVCANVKEMSTSEEYQEFLAEVERRSQQAGSLDELVNEIVEERISS